MASVVVRFFFNGGLPMIYSTSEIGIAVFRPNWTRGGSGGYLEFHVRWSKMHRSFKNSKDVRYRLQAMNDQQRQTLEKVKEWKAKQKHYTEQTEFALDAFCEEVLPYIGEGSRTVKVLSLGNPDTEPTLDSLQGAARKIRAIAEYAGIEVAVEEHTFLWHHCYRLNAILV